MGNIVRLFADDVRRLFSNAMCVIITVGLVVLPSIFAWYNVIACWNVFDNTGNLKVAVANSDEGYESDLVPLRINVGDQVVSALRANDQIHWVVTDEEDAVDGARSGRYYAAVVIPPQFSKDMLTFYRPDAEHAQIVYYSNEKKSAIAPKITDTGADSVSYQVNQVFAETLAEVALGLATGLSNYADANDASGAVATLATHIGNLADGVDAMADLLELYGQLMGSTASLAASSSQLLDDAGSAMSDLRGKAEGVPDQLLAMEGTVQGLGSSLQGALDGATGSVQSLEPLVDGLYDDADAAVAGTATALRQQGEKMAARSEQLGEDASRLAELAGELRERASQLEAADPDSPALSAVNSSVEALERIVSRLERSQGALSDLSATFEKSAEKLEDGSTDFSEERQAAKADLQAARSAFSDARADYESSVLPDLRSLRQSAQELSQTLGDGLDGVEEASSGLSSAASDAQTALGEGSSSLQESVASLRDASSALRSTQQKISKALVSGDADRLREVLQGQSDTLSRALSSPVGVERIPVFPADNFGSAMAPLYTTLALFIGALLIMVVVRPRPSPQQLDVLSNPKPRQLFLGHFGVCGLLSLAQSSIMALGNMFFLQVQVAHPLLFMVCFWTAGLVFTFIIYSLVFSFANLGKAIAVLLLIVQVTGCGGSFPLQILPGFVQQISPWLPATHVVSAMRAAMFGTFGNDFWVQIGLLALFVVPFALLGLALRKPMEKFMQWYLEKVEGSKLIC